MKRWKYLIPVTALLLLAGPAAAQTEKEERLRAAEAREAEVEQRLREAEEKMAEAARVIAELTKERLPRIVDIERRFMDMGAKPRLGVTIDDARGQQPVEGVAVLGVTPGSAADEAGLRTGDVLTSVNGESLSADNGREAARLLLDFMHGVEEGDKIDVEYLRNGNVGKVTVEPRTVEEEEMFFAHREFKVPKMPDIHLAPGAPEHLGNFFYAWAGNSWGDMELVEINEGLGKYFGTDEGLLVVRAPESNALQLEDGDVIQSIDGRKPTSVGHAMRILGSYQAGETLELSIMRDKKRRKLDIEIPDDRSSMLHEFLGVPPKPAAAPRAPVAETAVPVEAEST